MTPFGLTTAVFGAARLDRRGIELIAEHGFPLVELAAAAGHFDPGDAVQVRDVTEAAAAAGVSIAALSVSLPAALAAAPVAAGMGCPVVVARLGACRARAAAESAPPANLAALRRALDTLFEAWPAEGVTLALELPALGGPAPESLVDLLDSLDDVPVGVCLDLGHAHLAGGAPEAADIFSGFVCTTHLHDNHGREDAHRTPGAGSIDWPAALMACWKTGYAGPWILDLGAHDDVPAALGRAVGARARLQAILEDLAQPIAFTE